MITPVFLGEQVFTVRAIQVMGSAADGDHHNVRIIAESQQGMFSIRVREGIARQMQVGEEYVLAPKKFFNQPPFIKEFDGDGEGDR